jgi:predicted Zn-dependent peptidase
MFEHMAFKGTQTIGTKNYAAEKVALEKVEQTYAAYIYERDKRIDRDDAKVKQLQAAWQAAVQEAEQYVIPNQYPLILESNGAEGLNAFTNYDETAYHYSFGTLSSSSDARVLQGAQRRDRRASDAYR